MCRELECVFQLHDAGITSMAINEGFCVTASMDKYLRVWPLDFSDFFLEAQVLCAQAAVCFRCSCACFVFVYPLSMRMASPPAPCLLMASRLQWVHSTDLLAHWMCPRTATTPC